MRRALVAGLVVFGAAIISPAFHIDSELAKVYGYNETNAALGRWGISALHLALLPQQFVPFFTPLLSTILLAAAAVAAAASLDLPPRQRGIFVLLYMACPQYAYQMEFLYQADCIAFGIVLATIAYSTLVRPESYPKAWPGRAIASVILLTAGVSIYPSIIFIPPTLIMIAAVRRLGVCQAPARPVLRDILRILGLTVSSLALYLLLTRLIQHESGISPAPWLAAMIGWQHDSWHHAIRTSLTAVGRAIAGAGFYGNGIYATVWLAAAIIILPRLMRNAPARTGLIAASAAIAILLPFAIVLLLGQDQPPRSFLSEPIVLAGLWAIAASRLPERWSTPANAAAAAAVLYGAYHVSALFYADRMAFEADRLLGNRVAETMHQAAPGFDEHATPVYFVHGFTPVNIWRGDDFDLFGVSFFAWDGGNPDRIMAFLKALGIADLHQPSAEQIASVRAELPALPAWPNPGCVHLSHGVLIVKLGP